MFTDASRIFSWESSHYVAMALVTLNFHPSMVVILINQIPCSGTDAYFVMWWEM
jgi:hypothetical protein